ncbi:putative protein N(5)-glutamine methyltransferase [Streptomyces pathocidini]|uniref:putative protein N(5)-glutamine methyltransferase n=1 Tax=Streptomyces pathocidini TaxID=1650571 RepID=UPI0033C0CD79
MSVPPSPSVSCPSPSSIVERLRAAGCVFAEDEARLLLDTARTPTELAAMVERRVAGLPLEHVLGWAEFCGLRIAVDPGVFVPRRRTESLVRTAVALAGRAGSLAGRADGGYSARGPVLGRADDEPSTTSAARGRADGRSSEKDAALGRADDESSATSAAFLRRGFGGARLVVVDLCCGTGAVGVALAAALGSVELYAVDVDPAAVRCARRNVADAGGRVFEGDLYAPLPTGLRGRVNILAANVPYVPTEAVGLLPPEARDHEPLTALDGGTDGLDVLRRVAAEASRWLAPGGHLLIETSEAQAPQAAEAFAAGGLTARIATSDTENATVVIGTT